MDTFYVGITNTSWFSKIKQYYNEGTLGEFINFWTPGTKEFKAILPGELFLFKLHNARGTGERGEIVGGGYFSHFEVMTISDAWDKYGYGNGRESLYEMEKSLNGIKERINISAGREIGCIILEKVFFLNQWIDEPSDWKKTIVSGRKYTTDTEIGAEIYRHVNKSINAVNWSEENEINKIEKELNSIGLEGKEKIALIKTRVNQGIFRDRLLKKYSTCCLCKMENKALLIASHIKPWATSTSKEKLDIENGFLLCPNHDALFDGGYITFKDDGSIVISKRLSQNDCLLTNIKSSMKISLSEKNKDYLKYHRSKVFDKET